MEPLAPVPDATWGPLEPKVEVSTPKVAARLPDARLGPRRATDSPRVIPGPNSGDPNRAASSGLRPIPGPIPAVIPGPNTGVPIAFSCATSNGLTPKIYTKCFYDF